MPLQQDMHLMTINMGNLCGRPASEPEGGRATSKRADVTCDGCLSLLDALDRAGG